MTAPSQWQREWTKTGQLGIFDTPIQPSTVLPLREILVWNVGHPATSRATAQLEWLQSQNSEVIILTETAQSEGCEQLQEGLARAGYQVIASLPEGREYGSIIASKSGARPSEFVDRLEHLPYRAASVRLQVEAIEVIGVYVPSRDGRLSKSDEMEANKITRKRSFLESFLGALASGDKGNKIICGDFNVIPRNHVPPEDEFQEWEYDFLSGLEDLDLRDTFTLREPERQDHSWFGYFGKRYRFDYCYVSQSIANRVREASFDHSPRLSKLSDHSALRIKFDAEPTNNPV